MKKFYVLLTFLIFVGIFIPAVSADEILYDTELVQFIDTSEGGTATFNEGSTLQRNLNHLHFNAIENHPDLSYIIADMDGDRFPSLERGRNSFTYILNGSTFSGTVWKSQTTNLLGIVIKTRLVMLFNDWDIEGLSGPIDVSLSFGSETVNSKMFTSATSPIYLKSSKGSYGPTFPICYTIVSSIPWKNHIEIIVEESQVSGYIINLERTILGDMYTSTITGSLGDTLVFTNTSHGISFNTWHQLGDIDTVIVTNPDGREYVFPLLETEPEETEPEETESTSLTVYVKNSQTGALIANSRIIIDGLVDGEYYNVVNRTEPSGIFSITLQPTGGGKPNPDGYRLIVTADGYNNPMPEINFTVDDYKNYIYCLLDPIAGGPVNENKTFIDFFVRDMSSNPISGATVKFGKYTLITNSAGYTVFEVDKNINYTWTVSKSGYGPLTGNAVIGNDPRHTINTVLAPIVTPTTTTPIPTSPPIGPTPTMTAPTGEHVSNWLEWFAAHFGMILGGGVEIGKIFMWLCFTVPVGVYVGKEAKAGAAGFMAGAGIVTLFFVLIGWVPIWLVVLLALIIGLLYAKVFSNTDNGGGR